MYNKKASVWFHKYAIICTTKLNNFPTKKGFTMNKESTPVDARLMLVQLDTVITTVFKYEKEFLLHFFPKIDMGANLNTCYMAGTRTRIELISPEGYDFEYTVSSAELVDWANKINEESNSTT